MKLAARILIARARAANRKAARQRYKQLCAELADYATPAERRDLEAALDRCPDPAAREVRDILASQALKAERPRWGAIAGR
jgi:hypothetical protein